MTRAEEIQRVIAKALWKAYQMDYDFDTWEKDWRDRLSFSAIAQLRVIKATVTARAARVYYELIAEGIIAP